MTYVIGSMFSQAALLNHPFDDYFNVIRNMNPLAYFPLINSFDNFGTVQNVVTVNNRERIKLLSEGGARFAITSNTRDSSAAFCQMNLGGVFNNLTFGYKPRVNFYNGTGYSIVGYGNGFESSFLANGSDTYTLKSWSGSNDQFTTSLRRGFYLNIIHRVTVGATSNLWVNGNNVLNFTAQKAQSSNQNITLGIIGHDVNVRGVSYDLKDVFFFNRLLTDTEIYSLL